ASRHASSPRRGAWRRAGSTATRGCSSQSARAARSCRMRRRWQRGRRARARCR
ncbi:hypothetical protein CCHR01_09291, partial [Colletotrichum chrysophilum]